VTVRQASAKRHDVTRLSGHLTTIYGSVVDVQFSKCSGTIEDNRLSPSRDAIPNETVSNREQLAGPGDGRRQDGRGGLLVLFSPHVWDGLLVTSAGDRPDQFPVGAKGLAQSDNLARQAVFSDDPALPDEPQELVLADDRPRSFD